MGNILQATVSIEGVRPLLWHKFGPESIPLEKQERTGVAGHDPEEWRRTYMATSTGQLYVVPSYVFSTLCNGAKYTKRGKSSIQKSVAATLQVTDDIVLVDRFLPNEDMGNERYYNSYDLPVYIDVRSVVNPSTKARNVRYRVASSPNWKMTFHIIWDKTIISRSEMEAVVRDSGLFVGIGNGRAIGFGRFTIEEFCVAELSHAA